MTKKLIGIIRTLLAVICWYSLLPVHKALAVSGELNLETVEDPQPFQPPSIIEVLIKLVISLVIIAGLAYLTVKIIRKNMKVYSGGTNIQILDHYAFSLNKGIYITEIAGKVYVLGVTDHSISLITEIGDENIVARLVEQARERDAGPIIPPGILERIFSGSSRPPVSAKGSFNAHIQKQIKKLQNMVDSRGNSPRNDDRDE